MVWIAVCAYFCAFLPFYSLIFLYSIFVRAYVLGIQIASLWNKKARAWAAGRKNWKQNLKNQLGDAENIIWMHCASAGELEQGKPVLEALKTDYPQYKLLVTFFSPSGYDVAQKYTVPHYKAYLPADTKTAAKEFLEIVRPKLVVFVKYEYWFHYLQQIQRQKIPLLMVSAIYRENQLFFTSYGSFARKMLHFFTWIFVQDEASKKLLENIHVPHASVGGDTRFDRVSRIAGQSSTLPLIEKFIGREPVLIAGSTWPDDEMLLAHLQANIPIKLIIAPHEITPAHLQKIKALFPQAIFYSSLQDLSVPEAPVLVIDNIGMLSRLYQYAAITYIGGGFNKSGIHNTLEAAVWGKPVSFGPQYQKFKEARDLVNAKAAFPVQTGAELTSIVQKLLGNQEALNNARLAAKAYVQAQTGATQKIMNYIQENRLLTKV